MRYFRGGFKFFDMSERLKTRESSTSLAEPLVFEPPNTVLVEANRKRSEGGMFFWDRLSGPNESAREVIRCFPGVDPHQKTLSRWTLGQTSQNGAGSLFSHGAYSASPGRVERLFAGQRHQPGSNGQIEIRAYYPGGSERSSAIWLASRSHDTDQSTNFRARAPNVDLLVSFDYSPLAGRTSRRLLQVDYDQGRETARLIFLDDDRIEGAWGRESRLKQPLPKSHPWAMDGNPWPYDFNRRLDFINYLPSWLSSGVPAKTALDGFVDFHRLAEAIREQTEKGPAGLARLLLNVGSAD